MMKMKAAALVGVTLGVLFSAMPVFAHAVVSPNQVGVAATQLFTLSVPTEKEGGATTSVKLLLPAGLNFVTPVVQSGWKAEVKTGPIPAGMTAPMAMDGDVADTIQTEVDWTGGAVPSGQKALFQFSAQAPAQPGELDWKVYQGYADGSVVSWDLGPNDVQPKDDKGKADFEAKGPYSKTMVVNDLKASAAPSETTMTGATTNSSSNQPALLFSEVAIALAAIAIGLQLRKRA